MAIHVANSSHRINRHALDLFWKAMASFRVPGFRSSCYMAALSDTNFGNERAETRGANSRSRGPWAAHG